MGATYAEKVRKVKKPIVGLISNGEEAGKGSQLVKDTYPLLKGSSIEFLWQRGRQGSHRRRSGRGCDGWLHRQRDAEILGSGSQIA